MTKPTKTPALLFKGIHKSFGTLDVLKGVDLSIAAGESFTLLGRSGSGKSVLLKCLLRLANTQKGQILLNGTRLDTLSEKDLDNQRLQTGVVFQGSALFDSMPVWENIAFPLLMPPTKMATATAHKKAQEAIKKVGLPADTAHKLPQALSGGMKRRAALARAIIMQPKILLLDEPTAGLDPVFSRRIADLIQSVRKSLNATVLTITHDLALAETISDRVGVLSEGRLAWTGPFSKMAQQSKPAVKEFGV